MVPHWCAATLVNYILVAIFIWCTVSSVHCIFGVMYMHFVCVGIFDGASLVRLLLCNASLVHCFLVLGAIYFWCCVFGAMHCQLLYNMEENMQNKLLLRICMNMQY